MLDKVDVATLDTLEEVCQFYKNVCDGIADDEFGPAWQWGIHPSREMLVDYVKNGKVLVGHIGDQVAGVGAVKFGDDDNYQGADWKYQAKNEDIAVIHIYAINKDFRGQRVSSEMLQAMLKNIKNDGFKVVHLDAIRDNLPAVKLYMKNGFEFVEDRDVNLPHFGVYTLRVMECQL